MTRIGLISDTHSTLDPRVFEFFEHSDEIWHAGDIGDISVADELAAFRPLKAVYGNIDDHTVRITYPEILRWNCEKLDVMMIHIGGYPGRYSQKVREVMQVEPPGLFICGHSHILKVMYDKKYQCLHLNPGAAGIHGFHKMRTLLRFAVDGKDIKDLEIIELGERGAG